MRPLPEREDCNLAVEEIRAILEKHDLMGHIVVMSPDAMAYRMHFEATWSCATVNDKGELRFKTTHLFTKEGKKRSIERTLGALSGMCKVMVSHALGITEAIKPLFEKFKVSHKMSDHRKEGR